MLKLSRHESYSWKDTTPSIFIWHSWDGEVNGQRNGTRQLTSSELARARRIHLSFSTDIIVVSVIRVLYVQKPNCTRIAAKLSERRALLEFPASSSSINEWTSRPKGRMRNGNKNQIIINRSQMHIRISEGREEVTCGPFFLVEGKSH